MSLLRIAKWNYERNGLVYNNELEDRLFAEESNEFSTAFTQYLANPLTKLDCIVDMIDGYCDSFFVYSGTIAKQLCSNTTLTSKQYELNIMNSIITEVVLKHNVKVYDEDKPYLMDLCMQYVIEANEKKPKSKTTGKVKKGSDWVDPKTLIMELLVDRGFEEYPKVETEEEALKEADNATI